MYLPVACLKRYNALKYNGRVLQIQNNKLYDSIMKGVIHERNTTI